MKVIEIDDRTGMVWHMVPYPAKQTYLDQFEAFLFYREGERTFVRCVQVTGGEYDSGEADARLKRIQAELQEIAPVTMTVIEEGGYLPKAFDARYFA